MTGTPLTKTFSMPDCEFEFLRCHTERVTESIKNIGIEPRRTAFRSPWQNGIAERWIGSARQEMLDHVIVLNERPPRRLLHE